MKITIFYFSGTGNTWLIGKTLSEAFQSKGHNVDFITIEDIDSNKNVNSTKVTESIKNLIDNSDKLIIGYPIYGSVAPKIMEQFIRDLPIVENSLGLSVFTTVSLASGDGPVMYKDIFDEKGYAFEAGYEVIMNNNLNVPGFPNVLRVGTDKKVNNRNAKGQLKAIRMAEDILSKTHKVQGNHLLGRSIGNIQRKHIESYIRKLNEQLYVEEDMCINCNRCINNCPVNNIVSENGKIVIKDECIACMRCYHFCPKNAINITKKSLDVQKWPRFKGPTKEFIDKVLK